MASRDTTLYWFIFLSVVLGILVAIYPLAPAHSILRPELLCLVVICWVLQAPQYTGVLFAWTVGLTQDVLEGITWGGHAFALALVAYFCIAAHQRIKNFSILHQTFWVFVLVGLHQVVVNWVQGLAGYAGETLMLVLSAAISAMLWPLVYLAIARIRLSYRLP